ncbi:MAG: DUF3524 domain-containing protein [Bacteroidota bacterium]
MHILVLCPYLTDSHKQWAESYQRYSAHKVEIFSLPGRHWKWRMHGAAVTFAQQLESMEQAPDVIIATDMLDLTTFQALTRKQTAHIPTILYFHENQLTYPWSPTDQDRSQNRDRHYAWINYVSALAADQLWFNSIYHRQAFLEALPDFLRAFPDHQHVSLGERLTHKAHVLPVGIELGEKKSREKDQTQPPLILWNHRWEYDKGPEVFFQILMELQSEGVDFQLAVLGKVFGKVPAIFAKAKEVLTDPIVHWGYTESRVEYAHWLAKADILPVTAIHEYQGLSVIEAIHAGCIPFLPHRLSYPELIPPPLHGAYLYQEEEELKAKMKNLLRKESLPHVDLDMSRFDVRHMSRQYDHTCERLIMLHSG